MKNKQIYISIFFSVTILFFSYRQNENKKADFIPDSLIKAAEGIAIGKAKFGISEKEFNQLYPDSLVDLDGNLYNDTGNSIWQLSNFHDGKIRHYRIFFL